MPYRNVRGPAVEIAHLAGAHMGGANRKPRSLTIDPSEIDQLQERFLEGHGRIVPGVVRTDGKIHSRMRQKIWFEERRNTADQSRPIRERDGKAGDGGPQAGPSYQPTDLLRRTRTGAICLARRWTKKKGSFLRLIL